MAETLEPRAEAEEGAEAVEVVLVAEEVEEDGTVVMGIIMTEGVEVVTTEVTMIDIREAGEEDVLVIGMKEGEEEIAMMMDTAVVGEFLAVGQGQLGTAPQEDNHEAMNGNNQTRLVSGTCLQREHSKCLA